MTVAQLIQKLKKLPPKADVYWADHDQSEYEWNDAVRYVLIVDHDDRPSDDRTDEHFILKGKIVVLRG